MSQFIPTLDLLNALKTKCVALELSTGVPLFQEVQFYHTPDLVRALADLRASQKRMCLLVPSGDEFDNTFAGRELRTKASRDIEMLISDRSVSGVVAATVGDATNPGVVKIKDLVIEQLLGEQLGFAPVLVRMRPTFGQSVLIGADESKKISGRQAWHITWQLDAGHAVVTTK